LISSFNIDIIDAAIRDADMLRVTLMAILLLPRYRLRYADTPCHDAAAATLMLPPAVYNYELFGTRRAMIAPHFSPLRCYAFIIYAVDDTLDADYAVAFFR